MSSKDSGNSDASMGEKGRRYRGEAGTCPRRTAGTVMLAWERREEGTGERLAHVLEGQREQCC
jgi:hypothetical protein